MFSYDIYFSEREKTPCVRFNQTLRRVRHNGHDFFIDAFAQFGNIELTLIILVTFWRIRADVLTSSRSWLTCGGR